MKLKVRSFAGLRHILGKQVEADLPDGSTMADLLESLSAGHRDLRGALFGDLGIRDDINILVNGKNILSLSGLNTKLTDGDEIAMFPAAIGG